MIRRGNLIGVDSPEVFEAFTNLKGLRDRFDGSKSNGLGKKINGEISNLRRVVLKQTGIDITTITDTSKCSFKVVLPKALVAEMSRINRSIRVIRNQHGEKQACLR
jgi:hypothetical protein